MIATKNDSPLDDTIRARMQGIRGEIDQNLRDVSASARSMVDWKHYVKAHPWACLGTAAALGFLVAPKRSTAMNADLAAPNGPAKTGHPLATAAPTAAHRFVDAIVVAAVSIAARETIAFLGRNVGSLLGMYWE